MNGQSKYFIDAEHERISRSRDDRAMILNPQYWPDTHSLFVKKRDGDLTVGVLIPNGSGYKVLEGVVVREPEQVHVYADVDTVLAAGWVVD